MSRESWLRRIRGDLAMSAPEPFPLPAGAPPSPPRVLGFVAVTRRDRGLLVVSSVVPYEVQARHEADLWAKDDVHGAFVAELREVSR